MKPFIIMIGTLVAFTAVLIVLWALGYDADLLTLISYIGTMLILLATLIYAGFDSKRRWPDLSYWSRMAKILSFEQ